MFKFTSRVTRRKGNKPHSEAERPLAICNGTGAAGVALRLSWVNSDGREEIMLVDDDWTLEGLDDAVHQVRKHRAEAAKRKKEAQS